MNAKQRRVTQRKYTKEIAPKLIELQLMGATPGLVNYFRSFGRAKSRMLQCNIDLLRS